MIAVYITEHDFLKQGRLSTHIDKIIRETGKTIDDGLFEVFVNAQVNDHSEVAALMECFLEKEPDDPKFPEMQKEVHEIKHTEGGVSAMCESWISTQRNTQENLIFNLLLKPVKFARTQLKVQLKNHGTV